MKKLLLTFCVCVAMLMPAAFAQADVIYDWSYTTTAVLKDMQWTNLDFPGNAGPIGAEVNGGYAEYRWGPYPDAEMGKNSGLSVGGYSNTIIAGGAAVSGILITHFNNPITEGVQTPTGGTIYASVTLSAGAGISYTVNSSLSFSFVETPNHHESGFGDASHPEDIFFMTEAEMMKSIGSFVHDGEKYEVSLHSNIMELTGEYLHMAQEAGGYSSTTKLFGWTTEEEKSLSNGYELSLSVTHSPVPVPAAVWLMGTGLAGLAGLKRRSR